MMGNRLQLLRKQKGLSQEALADDSGLSVRTIQRIETGVSTPRVYTLKVLADALGVSVGELTDVAAKEKDKSEDYRFLQQMNLSILSLLFLPLANIFLPWFIWRKKKDTPVVRQLGARLISFQIWWTLISLFLLVATPLISLALTGQTQVGHFPYVGAVYFLSVATNIVLSLYIAADPQKRAPYFYQQVPALF